MKALIVDDEIFPAKYLEELLKTNFPEISLIEITHTPESIIKILKNQYFDIIFLDIELGGINAFEILEKVHIPSNSKIIFTTAHSEFAIDAFRINAIDYLLKPIKKQSLKTAINKVINLINQTNVTNESFLVFLNNEYINLKSENIVRFEADSCYTNIITIDQTILISKPIGVIENRLTSNNDFIRCHKSHIVNIKYITKLIKGNPACFEINNKDFVPISLLYKNKILTQLTYL